MSLRLSRENEYVSGGEGPGNENETPNENGRKLKCSGKMIRHKCEESGQHSAIDDPSPQRRV